MLFEHVVATPQALQGPMFQLEICLRGIDSGLKGCITAALAPTPSHTYSRLVSPFPFRSYINSRSNIYALDQVIEPLHQLHLTVRWNFYMRSSLFHIPPSIVVKREWSFLCFWFIGSIYIFVVYYIEVCDTHSRY